MNIGIVHLGSESECFVASSINKGLLREFDDPDIYWVVKNNNCKRLFYKNNTIESAMTLNKMYEDGIEYDLIINLSPEFKMKYIRNNNILCKGFNFDKSADEMYDILYGNKNTDMNIFQVYYRISGLSWRGDGCDITYYPKSKSKKNRAGIAVADARLRTYLVDNLEFDSMKKWIIPYKKNIFKKMDEINRCKQVVTDDFLTMNIAVFLRKYVHFLRTLPLKTRPEFFGNGQVHNVPQHILT